MSDEQTPDVTVDESTADIEATVETPEAAPVKGKRGKARQKAAEAPADAEADGDVSSPGAEVGESEPEPSAAASDEDESAAPVAEPTIADPTDADGADADASEVSASPEDDGVEGGAADVDDAPDTSDAGVAELVDPELFDPAEVADAPRAPHPLKPVVEALIFASPEPMTVKVMQRILEDQTKEDIEAALLEVRESYARSDGLQLVEVAGGYQIVTRPELYEWVRRLFKERTTSKLSVQALETLAVIAYKQPVTSGEIAEIRGVSATTGVLNTLLDRKLVKIVGRKQVVGRPFMYGTTREFLDKFGLRDLSDLPKVEDMSEALGFDLPSPVDEEDGVSLPFDGPAEATLFDEASAEASVAPEAEADAGDSGEAGESEAVDEPAADAEDEADIVDAVDAPATDAVDAIDDVSVDADTSDEER